MVESLKTIRLLTLILSSVEEERRTLDCDLGILQWFSDLHELHSFHRKVMKLGARSLELGVRKHIRTFLLRFRYGETSD
jgi:hypothetical protein